MPPNASGTDDTDKALWRRVTETVTPLKPERSQPRTPEPAVPPPPEAETPPEAPAKPIRKRPPPAAAAGSVPAQDAELGPGVAPGVDTRTLMRLRRGQIRIEASVDLHGHTAEEAHRYLVGFLAASQASRRRCVLVITGKGERGEGVLRRSVPRWLNEAGLRSRVLAFCHALPADGGEGALYVLLRRAR